MRHNVEEAAIDFMRFVMIDMIEQYMTNYRQNPSAYRETARKM